MMFPELNICLFISYLFQDNASISYIYHQIHYLRNNNLSLTDVMCNDGIVDYVN